MPKRCWTWCQARIGERHHQRHQQEEHDPEAELRAAAFPLSLDPGPALRLVEPVRALQRLGVGDRRLGLRVPGRLSHRGSLNGSRRACERRSEPYCGANGRSARPARPCGDLHGGLGAGRRARGARRRGRLRRRERGLAAGAGAGRRGRRAAPTSRSSARSTRAAAGSSRAPSPRPPRRSRRSSKASGMRSRSFLPTRSPSSTSFRRGLAAAAAPDRRRRRAPDPAPLGRARRSGASSCSGARSRSTLRSSRSRGSPPPSSRSSFAPARPPRAARRSRRTRRCVSSETRSRPAPTSARWRSRWPGSPPRRPARRPRSSGASATSGSTSPCCSRPTASTRRSTPAAAVAPVERTLASRQPVRIEGGAGLPAEAAVCAVLLLGQPPLGALQLLYPDAGGTSGTDLSRLASFGVRAAHALRASQRAERLELELERSRAILAVVGQAIAELSLAHTLETAVESLAELLSADRLAIYLRDDGRLVPAAGRGLAGPHARVAEQLVELAVGPFRGRGLLVVENARRDPHARARPRRRRGVRDRSRGRAAARRGRRGDRPGRGLPGARAPADRERGRAAAGARRAARRRGAERDAARGGDALARRAGARAAGRAAGLAPAARALRGLAHLRGEPAAGRDARRARAERGRAARGRRGRDPRPERPSRAARSDRAGRHGRANARSDLRRSLAAAPLSARRAALARAGGCASTRRPRPSAGRSGTS